MKTLLLVACDKPSRELLHEALSGLVDDLMVVSAADGEQAARVLATCPVDILVTELVMPVMDGFELLDHVLAEHPRIEIVVMGEPELGRTSQALSAGGEFRFLSKPVAAENLVDVVRSILVRPSAGRLSGLSLASLLRLLAADGRSCSIRVKMDDHRGRIDVYDGQPVNATCGGEEGKIALLEMLSWTDPEIEIDKALTSVARLIREPLPALLLEAALLADSSNGGQPSTPEEAPLPEEANAIAVDGEGSVIGSFSTFEGVGLQVQVGAAARALRAFVQLDGTLGAGVVELATGRSLAHVCRGQAAEFADVASEAARSVREGIRDIDDLLLRKRVRQLHLPGRERFQLVRMVRSQPRLMLVYVGRSGETDIEAASELLADFETTILQSA